MAGVATVARSGGGANNGGGRGSTSTSSAAVDGAAEEVVDCRRLDDPPSSNHGDTIGSAHDSVALLELLDDNPAAFQPLFVRRDMVFKKTV